MSKKYDISLYNHSVDVAIESEEMEKVEQALEPEFKYLRAIAKKVFGDEATELRTKKAQERIEHER